MNKRFSDFAAPTSGRGGVGRGAWVSQQRGRRAVLYVVKVYNEHETFYKLGITFDLSRRFSRLKTLYQWRTVARYSSYNAGKVWDLEQKIHALFAHLGYVPQHPFSGFTECYASVDEILLALPATTFFLRPVGDIL